MDVCWIHDVSMESLRIAGSAMEVLKKMCGLPGLEDWSSSADGDVAEGSSALQAFSSEIACDDEPWDVCGVKGLNDPEPLLCCEGGWLEDRCGDQKHEDDDRLIKDRPGDAIGLGLDLWREKLMGR
ncbi:hypothetical protein Dimus_008992 [Dionaea muscipula]